MTFDSKSKTITVEPGSDLTADSGVFFVHMLREMATEADAPTDFRNDWSVIELWLQCAGQPLTSEDDEKIGRAWRAYLATGVAPSAKLQPLFSSAAKLRAGILHVDKPHPAVLKVFNRFLATDAEIRQSRTGHTTLPGGVPASSSRSPAPPKPVFLSRNKRMLVSGLAMWAAWVVLRTSGDIELFGIYLESWDDDMFILNLMLPPSIAVAGLLLVKWIRAANK